MEAKAELDAPTTLSSGGNTPLHLAIARNYTNVAMVLLHVGADFDLANGQGYTPVHLAAREGLLGLAQSLCAFGCVVDVTASDGIYPIHLAAQNGHTEVVRCLCLAGCRIDVKNKEGVTPELAALSQGHGEISDLLKRLKRVSCLFIHSSYAVQTGFYRQRQSSKRRRLKANLRLLQQLLFIKKAGWLRVVQLIGY